MSRIFESVKNFLKNFIKLEYRGDRIIPCVHIKVSSKEERYLHFRLPVSVNRRKMYDILYAKKEIQPNKLVCDNYMGKGYGCNPKYVVEALRKQYPGKLDIVWIVSPEENKEDFPEDVRLVSYGSKQAKREYASAKVWLSNYHKVSYIRRGMYRKPGQFFIQMWHGSLGIKRIENNVPLLSGNDDWLTVAKESSEMTTHWISNSTFETAVYNQAFWGVQNVLEYGHPRNDLLINGDRTVVEKVKKHFGIENKRIMLYAPTFREDYRLDCYEIDYERLKRELKKKFGGEWVFVIRLHPRIGEFSSKILPAVDYIFDGTFYPDIQELLLTADSMITDYSSCIFDYLLTKRPGFIFATDISEYNSERGFYYPLETTPFPIATNNEALMGNIQDFDMDAYQQKIGVFLEEKGCIEDGMASERVADLICELMKV